MNWMPDAIRDGVIVILVISGPLVLTAAFIGLIIGILQAATQVQEQTIGTAIKIIAVFALIIFAGYWMFQYLNQYTARTLSTAFTVVPRLSQKVIPSDAYTEGKFKETTEKINTGPIETLKIIKPEKLDTSKIEDSVPVGARLLGAPETPKVPVQKEIAPVKLPQLPKQPVKPSLPLSNFQQPLSIPTKISPINIQDQKPIQNNQNTNPELINLVPGKPTSPTEELSEDFWQRQRQRKEALLNEQDKPPQDEGTQETTSSWLN